LDADPPAGWQAGCTNLKYKELIKLLYHIRELMKFYNNTKHLLILSIPLGYLRIALLQIQGALRYVFIFL